jgi:hypothetical protein
MAFFKDRGFNAEEAVALMGTHSLLDEQTCFRCGCPRTLARLAALLFWLHKCRCPSVHVRLVAVLYQLHGTVMHVSAVSWHAACASCSSW